MKLLKICIEMNKFETNFHYSKISLYVNFSKNTIRNANLLRNLLLKQYMCFTNFLNKYS